MDLAEAGVIFTSKKASGMPRHPFTSGSSQLPSFDRQATTSDLCNDEVFDHVSLGMVTFVAPYRRVLART